MIILIRPFMTKRAVFRLVPFTLLKTVQIMSSKSLIWQKTLRYVVTSGWHIPCSVRVGCHFNLTDCLTGPRLVIMHIRSRSRFYGLLLSLACIVLLAEPERAESTAVAVSDPNLFGSDTLLGESHPTPQAVVPTAPLEERSKNSWSGFSRSSVSLLWVGPRFGMGGNSPLGEEQKEKFNLYDLATLWRLPWSWEPSPSWKVESRLIGSAGQLTAAGTGGFMSTIIPTAALTTRGDALAIDIGGGLAFFTNHKFGVQDFGGPVQIITTTGISFAPVPGFRAGYRFQHFSDAGTYGPTSLGVDMHLIEMGYLF